MYLKWMARPRLETLLPSLIIVIYALPARVLPEEAQSVPEFRSRGEREWMR